MASRGSSLSAFQHINTPRCVVNSSFSIRSILDLPEENAENCAGSSRNDSPDDSYPVSLPLVPQVVRPMLHNYVDSAPRSTLRNWQDLGFAPYGHHWGYGAVSIGEQTYPMGISVFPKKRRRPMRKKKQRPLFSPHQIQTMEKEFAKQRYVTEDKRAELALEVNLTETQVKTWFQNRRTKWKKESRDEASATTRRPSHEDIEHVAFATQRINPFCQNVCINSLLNPLRVVTPYCNAPIFSTFASNPTFVSQFTL